MLVIHIGPRKTATTYLQSNFYRNRKALLARGWLYPVLSLTGRNAHHRVAAALGEIRSGRGGMARGIAKAGRRAARHKANILISSEGFRKWKAEDFALLGQRFGQTEILIAYTLRDPVDMLVSIWGETVKNGKAVSLADFARKNVAGPMKSPVLNSLLELKPIKVRPELQLRVLDFEALKNTGTDIYQAFGQHVLGLDDLQPPQAARRNASFSAEINDFLRLLAREHAYDSKKSEQLFSRLFTRTHTPEEMQRITETIRRAGADAASVVSLSRDAPWFDALEAEIATELMPLIVPKPVSQRLFRRGVVESLSYDIDRLAAIPEIRALLDQSLAKVAKAKLPWGRGRIVGMWRYLRRMISI